MGKVTRPTRAAVWALILCLLATPAGAGKVAASLPHVVETPNYHVETDISEQFAEVIGRHMEEIHKEYIQRFRDYGQPEGRYNVLVFRRDADYRRHVPPAVYGSTGAFSSKDRLLAAHADGRTAEEVLRTLYHEGFHQFMFMSVSPDCPVWLNEGLAEYFAEATWDGERFRLGEVPTSRLRTVQKALRSGQYVRFEKLFSLDTAAWLQNVRTDNRRADVIYAQSWSIVHFLAHGEGGRYAGMLEELIRSLSEGDGQETALQKAFGPNVRMEAFERSWAQHVRSLRPSPKAVCRDRMETLMHLAKVFNRDLRQLTGVEKLRDQIMNSSRVRWELIRSDGRRLSSDQRARVAQQFVCPLARDSDAPSFVVITDPPTSLPVLICNHHPGVIIKAYYQRDAAGQVTVTVEEEVRQLASPELKQAISTRLAQFR
ncbi:MAG: DUF1570 domain-containing protein [Candidatus Brocadiia bacterium]